jgi:hypothetical protein
MSELKSAKENMTERTPTMTSKIEIRLTNNQGTNKNRFSAAMA